MTAILGISAYYHDSGACLLRDEPKPLPALSRTTVDQRKFEEPAVNHDVINQSGKRYPPTSLMLRSEPSQCFHNWIVVETSVCFAAEIPSPAACVVTDQIIISARKCG